MNPSSNETAGLNLPPPVGEQQLPVTGAEQAGAPAVEQTPARPEQAPAVGQAAPPSVPAIPLPVLPPGLSATPQSDVSTTTQTVVSNIADDGDLIEKEWVNKAKAIVERTRDDPYQQSEQLTVVKADYMKKRYDKTIKLNK